LSGSKQGGLSIASHTPESAEEAMQIKTLPVQTTLARMAMEGADAERIADIAIAVWCDVAAALSPIIGQRGVAELYKRSIYLTRADYAWMAAVNESALGPAKFASLQTALAQQTSKNAAAANGALLQTFYDLLTKLIGTSLTERLFRSVWENLSSGHAAQDTTP
jgi:hypothetical protein